MKNFIILGEKMIGSRRPIVIDRRAMKLGGNERKWMEEKFSSYLYDEWAYEEKFSTTFLHKCGD
jgi:hypothetical protein